MIVLASNQQFIEIREASNVARIVMIVIYNCVKVVRSMAE